METWNKIDGYRNYFVSDIGNIKTSDYNHTGKEKPLSIFPNMMGYISCNLMQDRKRSRKLVHRLVALAFIPNPYKLPEVNHKDGNKANNNVSNLEWCSAKDNCIHASKTGLRRPVTGERHYATKLTTKQVIEVRELLKNIDHNCWAIARHYGVNPATIYGIKSGRGRKYEHAS